MTILEKIVEMNRRGYYICFYVSDILHIQIRKGDRGLCHVMDFTCAPPFMSFEEYILHTIDKLVAEIEYDIREWSENIKDWLSNL